MKTIKKHKVENLFEDRIEYALLEEDVIKLIDEIHEDWCDPYACGCVELKARIEG